MERRSKSTQQRKPQAVKMGLQMKLDSILNEKNLFFPLDRWEKEGSNKVKNDKYQDAQLHPAIQKVESIEIMELVEIKSLIPELQELVVHTPGERKAVDWKAGKQFGCAKAQSFILEQPKAFKEVDQNNKILAQHNQTVQYYKQESDKIKVQLAVEKANNQEYIAVIKKLEYSNYQLEKEVNLLLRKWHHNQTDQQRVNGLQQDFKKQLVVNLELQQMLLIHKLSGRKQFDEEDYKKMIKELERQLSESSNTARRQSSSLKAVIEERNKEIDQLKRHIEKYNRAKQQNFTSLQLIQSPNFAKTRAPPNFLERFANFSKEVEAKLLNVASTNPSLHETVLIDHGAQRKRSDSEYWKGNSLGIPQLLVKALPNRVAPQTDCP